LSFRIICLTINLYSDLTINQLRVFTPVGDLIRTLPKRSKTPNAIVAIHVKRAFSDSLEKVCSDFSKENLGQIKASTFKNGTLTIVAPTLTCAELTMRSGGLIKAINEVLGRKVVMRLRFKVR
jgi:hypothetical protein